VRAVTTKRPWTVDSGAKRGTQTDREMDITLRAGRTERARYINPLGHADEIGQIDLTGIQHGIQRPA
jgi:hypothetical protein